MSEIYVWNDFVNKNRDFELIRQAFLSPDQDIVGFETVHIVTTVQEGNRFGLVIADHQVAIGHGDIEVFCDGVIENKASLLQELGLKSDCDREGLICEAYDKWGDDLATHLKGDYAFVLYDKRKDQFICARAPFGLKALYYYRDQNTCVFATSHQKIIDLGILPAKINREYLAEYFAGYDAATRSITPYLNWFSVLPGESLRVSKTLVERIALWQPKVKKHKLGEADTIEAFRDLFIGSVRRKICDSDYSQFNFNLSGGLDSSAIACAFLHIPSFNPNSIHVYHDCHKNDIDEYDMERKGISDETILAQKICDMMGTTLNLRSSEQQDMFLKDFEPLRQFAEPTIDILCGLPKAGDGAKIRNYPLITGFGGDQVVLRDVNIKNKHSIDEHTYDMHMYQTYEEYLNPEFVTEYNLRDRVIQKADEIIFKKASQNDQWKKIYQCDQWVGNQDSYKAVKVLPFIDVDLVEFCLNLPDKYYNRKGYGKYILRKAFEEDLPEEIFTRKGKGNHVSTLYESIKNGWESIERRYNHLLLVEQGIVSKEKVLEMFRRFKYGTESHMIHTMRLLALELWLETKKNML